MYKKLFVKSAPHFQQNDAPINDAKLYSWIISTKMQQDKEGDAGK